MQIVLLAPNIRRVGDTLTSALLLNGCFQTNITIHHKQQIKRAAENRLQTKYLIFARSTRNTEKKSRKLRLPLTIKIKFNTRISIGKLANVNGININL